MTAREEFRELVRFAGAPRCCVACHQRYDASRPHLWCPVEWAGRVFTPLAYRQSGVIRTVSS